MDQKVIIYGLSSDGGDPPVITQRAFQFDTFGFLPVDLQLSGTALFSTNPFDPQFDLDDGLLDMMPAVTFGYMCGPFDVPTDANIFGRVKYCSVESAIDPTASMMVAELASELLHNQPAVNTAATVNASADPDQFVRITGFGFTVTAVAAIAAPLLVTLIQDPSGSPVTIWSGRVLVPAGQSKEVWIEGPFAAVGEVELTVPAPGATNFVTATLAVTTTGAAPS